MTAAFFEARGVGSSSNAHIHVEGPIGLATFGGLCSKLEAGEGGEFVLAADVVLDNRHDLVRELPGFDAGSAPDQEIVCATYAHYGAASPSRLMGDFAIVAIHPQRQEVVLIRDHIGARPLYYSLRGDLLLFATRLSWIVSESERAWPIDELALAEYLSFPFYPVSDVFFRGVHKVPAGAIVRMSAAGAKVETWWDPCTQDTIRFARESDYATACRELLDRAVEDRIGDGRIGAHFSGGLDSLGVAVLAQRSLARAGRSLVAGYSWTPRVSPALPDMGPHDERARIEALGAREGIKVRYGSDDVSALLRFVDRRMDLEGETDLVAEISVLDAAALDGVQTILSGWGGDEVFSAHGYGHVLHQLLSGRPAAAMKFAHNARGDLRNPQVMKRVLLDEILGPAGLGQKRNPFPTYSFLAADLREKYRDAIKRRHLLIKVGADPKANLKQLLRLGHLSARMEAWAERAAGLGIRYRYPLTDRRLLEFLLSIPASALFAADRPRGLAIMCLEDAIPDTATKQDHANETFRAVMRHAAWDGLAQRVREGYYDDDCPWLDMKNFRARASAPKSGRDGRAVIEFVELFAAARVWSLHSAQKRASAA